MSEGSFCKSPSIVIMMFPFDCFIPASNAAVCPKFLLNFIILTVLSCVLSFSISSKLLSVLPSSTKIISLLFFVLFNEFFICWYNSFMFCSSFNIGTTIVNSVCFSFLFSSILLCCIQALFAQFF